MDRKSPADGTHRTLPHNLDAPNTRSDSDQQDLNLVLSLPGSRGGGDHSSLRHYLTWLGAQLAELLLELECGFRA